jgi:hypothetical protein
LVPAESRRGSDENLLLIFNFTLLRNDEVPTRALTGLIEPSSDEESVPERERLADRRRLADVFGDDSDSDEDDMQAEPAMTLYDRAVRESQTPSATLRTKQANKETFERLSRDPKVVPGFSDLAWLPVNDMYDHAIMSHDVIPDETCNRADDAIMLGTEFERGDHIVRNRHGACFDMNTVRQMRASNMGYPEGAGGAASWGANWD